MSNAAVKNTAAAAGDLAMIVAVRDGITVTASDAPSTVGTPTRVAANVAAVTLLAANAARLGGSIYNSATTNLFIILSATAPVLTPGAERYSTRMVPGAYYEIPYDYVGIIQGIWDGADASGEALIVEMT